MPTDKPQRIVAEIPPKEAAALLARWAAEYRAPPTSALIHLNHEIMGADGRTVVSTSSSIHDNIHETIRRALEYLTREDDSQELAEAYEKAGAAVMRAVAAEDELRGLIDGVLYDLKLIRDQEQGCGGNLNPEEIYKAMRRLTIGLISSLETYKHDRC